MTASKSTIPLAETTHAAQSEPQSVPISNAPANDPVHSNATLPGSSTSPTHKLPDWLRSYGKNCGVLLLVDLTAPLIGVAIIALILVSLDLFAVQSGEVLNFATVAGFFLIPLIGLSTSFLILWRLQFRHNSAGTVLLFTFILLTVHAVLHFIFILLIEVFLIQAEGGQEFGTTTQTLGFTLSLLLTAALLNRLQFHYAQAKPNDHEILHYDDAGIRHT